MPDRYADAVRARRTELLAARASLTGAHRAELRRVLGMSRITASDVAAAALARLGRDTGEHVEHADRAVRDQLPALLLAALDGVADSVHARWAAELAPGVRRIAGARALDLGGRAGWPRLPGPRRPLLAPPAAPSRARTGRRLLTGAAEGLALWRLVLLPLAALPLVGLPALGGPTVAPLAVGLAAAVAVFAVRSRRVTLERASLRRLVDDTLVAGRAALLADLGRRQLEAEQTIGAELDAAVTRRRGVVEDELRALAPDPAAVSRA